MYKNKITIVGSIALAGILTLSVLAATSSTNRALAQEKPTMLTISVSPSNTKTASSYHVDGKLTSEGSGVGGATISFRTLYYAKIPGLANAVTHSDGTYSETWAGPLKYDTVVADYSGDSDHMGTHSNIFAIR
jgi:hypothetical protein